MRNPFCGRLDARGHRFVTLVNETIVGVDKKTERSEDLDPAIISSLVLLASLRLKISSMACMAMHFYIFRIFQLQGPIGLFSRASLVGGTTHCPCIH